MNYEQRPYVLHVDEGDKAKVSEHIEAPELCIDTKHPTLPSPTPIYDARLTEDLLGSVMTFQHRALISIAVSPTRKSKDFGDYCMCQQCMGSVLSRKTVST